MPAWLNKILAKESNNCGRLHPCLSVWAARCGAAQAIAHISSQVELLDLSVASPGAEELVAALYREYSI